MTKISLTFYHLFFYMANQCFWAQVHQVSHKNYIRNDVLWYWRPVKAPCNYHLSDALFMTDLMYLSTTTSICHTGEKVVKSKTYLLYLSHSTSICCIRLLVVKSTSALHLGKRYTKKLYLLQQKYLQCNVFSQNNFVWNWTNSVAWWGYS